MPSWLQELLVLVSMLPSTATGVPALEVPAVPVTSDVAVTAPSQVFADGFDAPYADRWTHVSSSTADKVTQASVDGRTVVELRPEAHLEYATEVPFEPGTTYRVSATLKMPRETGVHTSFWLRTNDLQRAGEIDVVESWGDQKQCSRVQVAYYWRYAPPIGEVECAGDRYPRDMDAWHTYAVEFTYQPPGQDPAAEAPAPTRYFVDGVETWSTPHAPVSAEHLRLQNKRNCPDEQQPTCGETSTTPSMYVDAVTVEVVGRVPSGVPADLTAIRETEAGAEAHVLSAASGYAIYSNQTPLPIEGRGWRFTGGDYDGDLATDVYAIRMAGRDTAQVQVLDGGNYLHTSLNHATIVERRGGLGRTRFLAGDADGDGRDDLYLLSNRNGDTAHLTVLDADTDFQTRLIDVDLPVPPLPRDRWRMAAGDYNFDGRDDLYLVDTQAGANTAVHVLDARTQFTSWLAQTTTAAPALDSSWVATAADDNGDGRADLVLIDRDAGGATETHSLDAASGFATYTRELRTVLGPTTDTTWTIAD
ncbi:MULTISPECIES: family 16 glycosylhydrolase [Nocardioides]|uniref:family 16 glycosylhydrolase n=1 Tax=Nocardioides TaxID=1839 RepID=UPI0003304136|nr:MULTISPECIES: family 16 glycosylhydrolase [Nocardioides]EON25074.1 integrin-like repeat-containing lysozyme [Nocardioides sp. CF8]